MTKIFKCLNFGLKVFSCSALFQHWGQCHGGHRSKEETSPQIEKLYVYFYTTPTFSLLYRL